MALCEQADVEKQLQVEFDNDPEPSVTYLIENATQLIRDHCDQHLEDQPAHSETLDGSGAAWLFPHEVPIRAVTSVTEDGQVLTAGVDEDYLWYPDGRLLRRFTRWTAKPQSVEVVYDAGYETIPDSLRAVCAAMVARAFQDGVNALATPAGAGAIQSLALAGSDTISYATGGTMEELARFVTITEDDRAALAAYRREAFA